MTSSGRPLSEPSRLTAAVFLLLVGATIAAFFAAQRLKHQPPLLRQKGGDRAFSPNGDGTKDTARIKFKLPKPDDVTVTILDEDGGAVARVVNNRKLPAKRVLTLRWDGRSGEGTIAPEGVYHVRVGLRKRGRTNTLERTIEVDLTPPRVRLAPVRGPSRGPFVVDGQLRRTATVRLTTATRNPSFFVWRTDGARSRLVVRQLPTEGKRRARWDGTVAGKPAPPGTYLIAAEAQDRAGNVGSAPRELPPPHSGADPGGVGVAVRPLAVTPPPAPVAEGSRTRLTVEAGGRRYRWSLRRVGARRRVESGGSAARRLRIAIPSGPAGAYVLTVEAGKQRARAVVPVTGARPRRILVVLPLLTWQGRNDVDDNGDGLPDSLARGRTARLDRPFAHGGLPRGFNTSEAPLLAFLERNELRYDITTDLALARSRELPFVDHEAVVLAGDARWFQESLGKQMRTFVERGGGVLSLGVESLRRTTRIKGGRLQDPSDPAAVDMLGARVGPLQRDLLELLVQSDELDLFAGTAGSLGSFDEWETTSSVAPGRLVALAGETGGSAVFVAYRLGKGLVFRPGVVGWGMSLDDDIGPAAETMRRIWTLLG